MSVVAEQIPTHCFAGHPLRPKKVLVGWTPCSCPAALAMHGGHRTWTCQTCWHTRSEPVCEGAEGAEGAEGR